MNLFLCYFRIMLCWKDNGIQTNRLAILIIFNRNLCLAVRSEVRQCTIFTNLCQLTRQLVSQCDRIWHIFFCFIGSISKHHTLVSGTDRIDLVFTHFCFQSFINSHCDVCGLLIDCCDNCTCFCIKTVFSTCIADFSYGISYDFLDVNISTCCDLTHYKYKTCCCCCLACNTSHRVFFHDCVKNRIRNGIAHFVRMAFCYWFRSK